MEKKAQIICCEQPYHTGNDRVNFHARNVFSFQSLTSKETTDQSPWGTIYGFYPLKKVSYTSPIKRAICDYLHKLEHVVTCSNRACTRCLVNQALVREDYFWQQRLGICGVGCHEIKFMRRIYDASLCPTPQKYQNLSLKYCLFLSLRH